MQAYDGTLKITHRWDYIWYAIHRADKRMSAGERLVAEGQIHKSNWDGTPEARTWRDCAVAWAVERAGHHRVHRPEIHHDRTAIEPRE